MDRLERTHSGLDTEWTTNAASAEVGHSSHGSISSTTAAGGKTSRKRFGRQQGRPQDGKWADADTCRFLSCFPWRDVTQRWWSSWLALRSGSSHQSKWRSKGVEIGGSLAFVDLFCCGSILSFSFPLSKGTMGSSWELCHLTGLPGGRGVVDRHCHARIRVNTVWIKQNK